MFKPCGTLGGCLKLKKRSAWLYAHSLQNQQTSDTTCAHTTGPSDARQAVELSADVPVHPNGTLGRGLKLKCRSAWFSSFHQAKRNMLCLTTRTPATVDYRAFIARTARRGYHRNNLNTSGMHSSKLTERNVEFNVPRVLTSTLRATLSRSNNMHRHNRNFLAKPCSQPPAPQTPHTCDQSSVASMFKPCGTLGGCLKLKKRSAWLFGHSLQNQQTDDKWHNMCAHHLVTKVFRSMILVVWAQRVVQI